MATSALAAAVISTVPRRVLGAGETPPSERFNIAGIGVRGMEANNLRNLESQSMVNVVALCDVDHDYAAKTFKKYLGGKIYTNCRELSTSRKTLTA